MNMHTLGIYHCRIAESFFHPDFTVGTGIAPVPAYDTLADCHRRWGIAPRPEDTVQFFYSISCSMFLVKKKDL